MILVMNGSVGRATLQVARPLPDGTKAEAEPFEAVVMTLGLGDAGELQIAMPIDLGETLGAGMEKAATMRVVPATMLDMPNARRNNGTPAAE